MTKKGWLILRCKICGKQFKLRIEDYDYTLEQGRYITCSYNGKHNKINVIGIENTYGQIKKCMDNRVYKKVKGVTRQIK